MSRFALNRTEAVAAWLAMVVLGAWSGCSSNGATVATDGGAELADGLEADLDTGTADTAGDAGTELPPALDVRDAQEEYVPECLPGTGCFSEPCSQGKDCLSGWCVEHMGNLVCTSTCVEECPAGWSCTQVTGQGRDVTFVCVSSFRMLCRPCTSDADCAGSTGQEDVCVDFGTEGRFCGAACGAGSPCPDGYVCKTVADTSGVESQQCAPQDGTCECSQTAVDLALHTECSVVNDFGTCTGKRVCTDEGLTECDAKTPIEETCNSVDDDCDGEVDEETCDDGNPCTADSCLGDAGCQHDPLVGTNCDDQDACTVTDHCEDGVCAGTPVACNDGNPCTDDVCDGVSGCAFPANALACDDGDPCTLADACSAGACKGVPVACDCDTDQDCAKLEDGNLCNGTLFCDKSGVQYQCKVVPGSLIQCELAPGADPQCLDAVCNPASGQCSSQPANAGLACDDGDDCTYGEACAAGLCAGGKPVNCNDGSDCTADSCNPALGCVHQPLSGACNDADACTYPDACGNGACIPGPPVSCDDGNPCTADACAPAVGCTHAATSAGCDDGDACTTGDHCQAGACVPASKVSCDDGNPCTSDACTANAGCVHEFNNAPCSDGSVCTVDDMCQAGACTPGKAVNCNDNNACTDDSCSPLVGCLHVANAKACDDLDPCTEGDTCSGGVCVGPIPFDCDDANPCTNDLCVPMAGCSHANNSSPCSDGSLCTLNDTCVKGVCIPGKSVVCDDGNPCTADACDKAAGCSFKPSAGVCSDNNDCTTDDHCEGGKCVATAALQCDDSNPCTKDSCLPGGGCLHETQDGAACSDGNACTVNDTCSKGACAAGAPLDCDDGNPCTDDSCTGNGKCVHAANSQGCDDQNPCTTGDTCSGGFCKGTGTLSCDDGNVCTTDYCHPVSGCGHADNAVDCNDGNACTTGDTCAAGTCAGKPLDVPCQDFNPCTDDACDPKVGCTFTPNAKPCTDGNACTTGDACSGGQCQPGEELSCDDANPCTDDSCSFKLGCVHYTNSADCDDGSPCTVGDKCAAGGCAPGPKLNCDDSNPCTTDSCASPAGCQHVAAPDGTECASDNNPCTVDVCKGGVCDHSGQGWSSWSGHCYRFFEENLSWQDARNKCIAAGADLVAIANQAENDFVATLANTTFFTGLNDIDSEGSWKWSNGSGVSYTNWAPGEPNNSGNEDCMHYYIGGSQPNRWNDIPCGAAQPYMCEK